MKTHICLVRHGETEWNNERRIQGIINNKLNENGKKQARMLGNYLKSHDNNWDVIISSPLDRAYETAEIIKDELKFNDDIIIDQNLIERNFGKAEGLKITEIFDKIVSDNVEGLEKSVDLQNRVYDAILNIAKKYFGKKVLIVTHSHVIKGLTTKLDSKYSFWDKMQNSALNYFVYDGENILIEKINVNPHIKDMEI
ncbi:MAG TPA: histidine phosphatase family protein [Acholeplasmataceae bacterium]|nr:histidine phosphatase family protein [Acholeplasmataceae bacterium]